MTATTFDKHPSKIGLILLAYIALMLVWIAKSTPRSQDLTILQSHIGDRVFVIDENETQ